MKYKVNGTIELNWSKIVEAESEDEAERIAISYAEDGMVDMSDPVDTPEVHTIQVVEA